MKAALVLVKEAGVDAFLLPRDVLGDFFDKFARRTFESRFCVWSIVSVSLFELNRFALEVFRDNFFFSLFTWCDFFSW